MKHEEYVGFLKSTFLQAGTKLVVSYVVSNIPFFKILFFNNVLSFFVEKILWIAIEKTELGAFFLYVDLRVGAQGRAFEKAALLNYEIQKNGSKEQKINSEKELINAFRDLVKFSN